MNYILGAVALGIFAVMLWAGRARKGETAAFLRGPWIWGITYAMLCLIALVTGVALLLLA